ncbi:MAG: 23S rRNA (guanosine(2251)-2'-O)-methyltransferase RlmB [Angelakisella sp.]
MQYNNEQETSEQETVRTVIIAGRNPVMEALRSGQELESIHIQTGDRKGPLGRILAMAKDRGIPVKDATAEKLASMSGITSHQGVAAVVSAAAYSTMEDIRTRAGAEPLFVIIADGIEDPHNLGAIIRTAEAAGAHGIIIPKRHSAGLTATAAKAAAGAIFHIPVVRVSNLASTMEELKEEGVWFYCADMDGQDWCSVDYKGGVGLVIGSEGAGVSRLIKEKCDFVVSLPMRGEVNSLNASVAGSIVMYEITRQRLGLPAKNR